MTNIVKAAGFCVVGGVINYTIGEAYPKGKRFINIALAIVSTIWTLTWSQEFIENLQTIIPQLMSKLKF